MSDNILKKLDLNSEDDKVQRYMAQLHGVFSPSYIRKYISKNPDNIDTLVDILGTLLLIIAHPEMVSYELVKSPAWGNLSKLADAGWESMGREYIDALREVDSRALQKLIRLF